MVKDNFPKKSAINCIHPLPDVPVLVSEIHPKAPRPYPASAPALNFTHRS
jgi:hypothetical protein